MKSIKTILGLVASLALVASAVPTTASADDELIYGTMNIPYADFYKAELADSVNPYEVDAVSSATTTKWAKNGEGDLCEGTYNQANDDGTGTILGVTYPVALTSETLAELGDDNYGFVETDEVPSAYKTVTVEDGVVSFSAVNGESVGFTADATIATNDRYGDYLVDVNSTPEDMGAIYGVVLTTETNESYGLRHLENIWRGELAWSVGFTTQEVHGNTLSYENFQGLMGDTITNITYITKNGYYTLDTSLYVPLKFDGSISVENASIDSGSTTITANGIPEDYALSYSVEGLEAQIVDGTITFENATPSSYTLQLVDTNGVYMGLSTTFELTTDVTPAQYDGSKLVKADDASDEDFANYLSNISKVSVNGVDYSTTGKGAVKIIGEDGTIDTSVTSGREQTPVFDGADSYEITVKASGYTNDLTFTLTLGEDETTVTTTSDDSTNGDVSTDTQGSEDVSVSVSGSVSSSEVVSGTDDQTVSESNTETSGNSNEGTTSSNSGNSSNGSGSETVKASPNTSTQGVAVPVAILGVATLGVAISNKKRKD